MHASKAKRQQTEMATYSMAIPSSLWTSNAFIFRLVHHEYEVRLSLFNFIFSRPCPFDFFTWYFLWMFQCRVGILVSVASDSDKKAKIEWFYSKRGKKTSFSECNERGISSKSITFLWFFFKDINFRLRRKKTCVAMADFRRHRWINALASWCEN